MLLFQPVCTVLFVTMSYKASGGTQMQISDLLHKSKTEQAYGTVCPGLGQSVKRDVNNQNPRKPGKVKVNYPSPSLGADIVMEPDPSHSVVTCMKSQV